MSTIKIVSFLFIVLFFCSTAYTTEKPQETKLPPLQYETDVLDIYQTMLDKMSEEDRDWYKKFHEGIMFFNGWKEITKDVLKKYSAKEKQKALIFMQHLGVRIGTEWSKDNDIRRIDTDMLKSWGKRLKEAAKKEKNHLTKTLYALKAEVEELLKANQT